MPRSVETAPLSGEFSASKIMNISSRVYCTVSTVVLLVTRTPDVVLVMVAVMFVVPGATLVAYPLPLVRPELIVATFVFDDVQVTASVRSLLLSPFP